MDTAKSLIRTVVRSFYDTKHALVIDAVLLHSVIPYDDLAYLLGMQTKDLRKLCGLLRENGLLAVQSRPEAREGMTRPLNKEYCFVNFHETIDAIKFKVASLSSQVQALYKPVDEKKDYFCPRCGSQWTQLEVLDKVGPMGFECHRCGGPLEREELKDGEAPGHEKFQALNKQIKPITDLMQQVEVEDLPTNDFEKAMALRVVVERDRGSSATVPVQDLGGKKSLTGGKGSLQSITALDVSVISNEDNSAVEKAEEAKRKAAIAAQNTLPIWHTTSTVASEQRGPRPDANQGQSNGTSLDKEENEDKKDDILLDDELTAYYAQLAQEKERQAKEDREADEGSGDDEDDFEDVLEADETPETSTPAMSLNNKSKLKGAATSESSGTSTNAPTPANDSDEPPSKKVKFEETSNSLVNGSHNPPSGRVSDNEDDDDGEEFEDV